MSDKTLGQVAFETWIKSHLEREGGDTTLRGFITWDDQVLILQDQDWQAAAEAVIKHELRDIGDRYVKERAIIEAARAVKRAHDRNIRSIQPIVSLISLIEAVEALEEVERER